MNEQKLAEQILEEYTQFLGKKGYYFKEKIGVKISNHDILDYDSESGRYLIKVSGYGNVLHEATHIILMKDGINVDLADEKTKDVLSIPYKGVFSNQFIKSALRLFVQSLVEDFYVERLLLNFSGEFQKKGLLQKGFEDYHNTMKKARKQLLGLLNQEIKKRQVSEQISAEISFLLQHQIYNWFIDPKISAWETRFAFDSYLEKLDESNIPAPGFFRRRAGVIKKMIDSLPSYETLKEECRKDKSPRTTKWLSVLFINLFYYGLDIRDGNEVDNFARLIEEKNNLTVLQKYGISIDKNKMGFANDLVKKMREGPDAFVKKEEGGLHSYLFLV